MRDNDDIHAALAQAMSEEQLSALLAKLRIDSALTKRIRSAQGLDDAVALAKDAGFDVSKADWFRHLAKQTLELSDQDLERVGGGNEKQNGSTVKYSCRLDWC